LSKDSPYLKIALAPLFIWMLLLALAATAPACRSSKKVSATLSDTAAARDLKAVEVRTKRSLISGLKENEFRFEYLSSKFSASLDFNGKVQNVNVSVRARRDSILWLSFSLLGIEGARMVATLDSVKFIDRISNKYFAGDYKFLSELFNTDIDFELMQSVLIGNSVEFFDEDEKLKSSRDSSLYLLSTIRKGRIKRILNRDPENNNYKELIQRIWISPDNLKIVRIVINDLQTGRTFEAAYSDFRDVGGSLFPYKSSFNIEATQKIKVDLEYSRVSTEPPGSFSFNIPASYERIR